MKPLHHFINRILCGNSAEVLRELPADSIDLVITDPPYLVNYRARDGRTVAGDDTDAWLAPVFTEVYRVLKPDRFCVSFYGWTKADRFLQVWKGLGFRPVGHFVWVKDYASSQGFTRYQHEQAYLLAKGRPPYPHMVLGDVLEWRYTGNALHPTQKPLMAIVPLVLAYSKMRDVVLDPFVGSGTTAVAAQQLGRRYVGIDLNPHYCRLAEARLRQPPA
jgi:adenine-specific DNA-methyltransferase